MTKHTPKPWVVGKRGLIMAEVGKSGPHGEGFAIAEVYGCDEMIASGERDANANLFAAAPDLLAACKAHVQLDRSDDPHHRWHVRIGDIVESRHDSRAEATKRIRALRLAAIAKAGGSKADGADAASVPTYTELVEVLRGLYQHCVMVHRYWGDGCNRDEANAVINAGQALLDRIGGAA